ncbi:hypothetical protein L596_016304 [Steinernema carpocapsae]|uniref:Uncharacterized protein n=1 Tax=Steinernema carpocapsae TaxID=34508 RepID=A0A4U5NIL1_STECR|nr:hypothetical protein L596_016304 [Steinernema carpocapsae]
MEGLETKTVENIVSLIPAESLHLLVPLDSKWGVIASKRLNSYVCGQVVLVVQGQKVQISGMRCHMLTGEVLPWKGVADFSDEDLEQTTISSIVITGNVADPPQLNLCAYAYDRSLQDAGFRSGLLRFLKLCRISTTAEIRVEELSADVGRLLIDALRSGFQRVFVRKLNFDLHLFFDRMLKSLSSPPS